MQRAREFLYHELISPLPYIGSTVVLEEELDETMQNRFGISAEALHEIVEGREEGSHLIEEKGGVKGIADMLHTSVNHPFGIDASERSSGYANRLGGYGHNDYIRAPPEPFVMLFIETFKDPTLIILIIAAVVSLALGIFLPRPGEESTGWIEGTTILLAVMLVSIVTAASDWNKERQFRSLDSQKDDITYEVWRGGEVERVNVKDILVGDIVLLGPGDKIPADGLFVDGRGAQSVSVDESVMTGETEPVTINEAKPVMLSGTMIQEGYVHMLVIATGARSQWGQLLANLSDDKPETPLQVFLDKLATWIGYGGFGVATVVFLVMSLWWLIDQMWGSSDQARCVVVVLQGVHTTVCDVISIENDFSYSSFTYLVDYFIIAVTIVVVAVPEGLPLAVTISLAYSMRQMMRDQNLVRHLDACETMGGATTICSDKTGTLTENRMTVVDGSACRQPISRTGMAFGSYCEDVKAIIMDGVALNTTARVLEDDDGQLKYIGSSTECALLQMVVQTMGGDFPYMKMREMAKVEHLLGFSSARKRMSVIVQEDAHQFRMHTKGASEIVLARCSQVLRENGSVEALSSEERREMEKRIDEMASKGLRTLSLATRVFEERVDWESEEQSREDGTCEHLLTLVAIVGIEDPVREAVPSAVRQCQRAGIFVRMVTGDNIKTASKIARDCNILREGGIAMEGPEFRTLSAARLDEVLPKLQVLARSSPLDKKTLVEALMDRGEVVSVTGDGTNDAPALRSAHVGLSMGIAGTEVAKEASDIVILDDNFLSIVKSVLWGRCVYDNVRKFLMFQLTVNLSALIIAVIGALTNRGTPLTAIQLLWVNMIMDTMAALALGTEKPTADLLERKPYGLHDSFISRKMWKHIIGQGLYQVFILSFVLYFGAWFLRIEDGGVLHYTLLFNIFVWMQVFNELCARKVNDEMNILHNIHKSYIFIGVIIFTVVLQVVFVELGGSAVDTVSLFSYGLIGVMYWVGCILMGAMTVPISLVLRLIPIPEGKSRHNTFDDDDHEALLHEIEEQSPNSDDDDFTTLSPVQELN